MKFSVILVLFAVALTDGDVKMKSDNDSEEK